MKVDFSRFAACAFVSFVLLGLSACTGYQVIDGAGQAAKPIDKNSLRVVWKSGSFAIAVEKHERSRGLPGHPVITKEDSVLYTAKAELVKLNLQHNLIDDLSAEIRPYIAKDRTRNRYALVLELVRIVADTDGSRDVTLTAALHSAPGAESVTWTRTIKVIAPRFSSDDALSSKVADAIVEQMRASSLIE